MKCALPLGCSLWLLLASSPALAGPLDCPPDHPGRHHAEYPWLIGFKLGYLSLFEVEEEGEGVGYVPAGLVGLFFERTIIHEWLELELTIPVGFGLEPDPRVFLPIDLHIKKPFHPSPRVSPYVAIGPAMDLVVRPQLEIAAGLSASVGTYVWFSDRVGLDLELDYNLVFERPRPAHDVLFAIGPAFRL